MRRAIDPCAASLRSVGTGSFGSSSAKPGNPSRLITTTVRRAAGGCAAAGKHQANSVAASASFVLDIRLKAYPDGELHGTLIDRGRADPTNRAGAGKAGRRVVEAGVV